MLRAIGQIEELAGYSHLEAALYRSFQSQLVLLHAFRKGFEGSQLVFLKYPRGGRLVDTAPVACVVGSGCGCPTGLVLVPGLGAGLPFSFGAGEQARAWDECKNALKAGNAHANVM